MAKRKVPRYLQPEEENTRVYLKRQVRPKTENQEQVIRNIEKYPINLISGPAGCGKALPVTCKLYKKDGPILMKDVKIGDEIANEYGEFSKVVGIYPQGFLDTYRIHFKDGTYIDCSEDHLWCVGTTSNGWKDKIFNTKDLIDKYIMPSGRKHLYIKTTRPVQFEEKEFLIDPYLMGILISEGYISGSTVGFSSGDAEIVKRILLLLPEGYCIKQSKSRPCDYRIVKEIKNADKNILKEELIRLGIYNNKSETKFIPKEYLYSSIEQRKLLLNGLMDGDGTVSKQSGMPVYYTVSKQLSDDFQLLINSFGGITKTVEKIPTFIYKNEKKIGKKVYISHICLFNDIDPFWLNRKQTLIKPRTKYFPKRIIDKIEKLSIQQEMQCIKVDNPTSLFLTDNFLITHNTHLAIGMACQYYAKGKIDKIILTRPVVEAGESLGYLPGDLDEKMHPYLIPMYDELNNFISNEHIQVMKNGLLLEVVPLAYTRGRNFHNCFVVCDEAQNMSYKQIKMLLTRLGEGSKMVLAGDIKQSDLHVRQNDFEKMLKILDEAACVGVFSLTKFDIIRSEYVVEIEQLLERYENEEEIREDTMFKR